MEEKILDNGSSLLPQDIVLQVPGNADIPHIARWMAERTMLPRQEQQQLMETLIPQLQDREQMEQSHGRIGIAHGRRLFFVEIAGGFDIHLAGDSSILQQPELAYVCWQRALAHVYSVIAYTRIRIALGPERKIEREALRRLLPDFKE